jgi:hypothetical protein
MVIIPDPGDRAHCADNDSDVGNSPDDEDHIRVDLMMPEIIHDLENEPACTGQRTTAVNASEMLWNRCEVRLHPGGRGESYLENRRAAKPPP